MAKTKNWIARCCALGLLIGACFQASAHVQDATILIDRALNSPTLTIRYSDAHVALIELRINDASYSARNMDPGLAKGETNFTIDLASLRNGDNDIEVRLYDKDGRLVGSQKSTISTDDGSKAPVFMMGPKMGATVQGPVQLSIGFNKELRNAYVSFFIDNQFKSMSNSPPFSYLWDTTRDANGWHDVEAWAVDDTSVTYKTRRVKVFVNNPGGNTARQFPSAPPPSIPVVKPALAPSVQTVTAPIVKAPITLPAVAKAPTPNLQPSVAAQSLGTTAAAGVRASAVAVVQPVVESAAAVLPRAVAAPAPAGIQMANIVHPVLGVSAGLKAATYGTSIATGAQMLLPTGKRIVMPKVVAPVAPVVAATPKPAKVEHIPQTVATAKSLPVLPSVTANVGNAKPVAPILPKATVTPVIAAAAPATPKVPKVAPAVVVTKPVQAAKQVPATAGVGKVAGSLASASLLRIGHGTKMPNIGTFPIVLDAKMVQFDQVKPRVQDGIPLTPFRYLFEQSGGKVDWEHKTKTVTANGHNKEIYIKIGDKLAKVNNFPIEMDLAPFIDHGRTIIPLSFLQDSLGVQVDYDPATGHVLITSNKHK